VPAADALALAPLLAGDTDRHVVRASVRLVEGLEPLVPDALLLRFEKFVADLYGRRARELGWSARPGESEDVRLLRLSVVSVTARLGRDTRLQREAVGLAHAWLEDPSAVDPDLVPIVLATAAGGGDRALFDRLRDEAVRTTTDRERRKRLLTGLATVRDPGLAREALALTLDERVDARESVWILWALASQRETRRAAFDFLKSHYDALVARLPRGEFSPPAYFPWIATGLCAADTHQEMEGFFKERSASVGGGPRVLAQALEDVDQCVARKQAQQPGLIAFLESRPGG
jgi:alanyl aminopeptidase